MRALHVSVSQVRQYLKCPRQFELTRVRGAAPAFVPAALAFGSAIHAGLASFYVSHQEGRLPTLETMQDEFERHWRQAMGAPVPLHLDEGTSWEALLSRGRGMLHAFYAASGRALVQVEGVEVPFEVELHDPDTHEVIEERLVGTVDAIVREGDRRVLLEHKTSARKYGEDQLRYDTQVSAYKLAARQQGLGDVGLRFQVLTKTERPAVQVVDVERDRQDEDDFARTAIGVLRAVDAGAFYPIRGWACRSCPVAHACVGAGR